jgi:hypothetical protein
MMIFSSKRSATLRTILRTSSSGKSTESVSRPEASVLFVAVLGEGSSGLMTTPPAGAESGVSVAAAGDAGAADGVAGGVWAVPDIVTTNMAATIARERRRVVMVTCFRI